MTNHNIAKVLRNIARLLELENENPFRIRAYERAANAIESLNEEVGVVVKEGRLTQLFGIGKDLAAKISELDSTGKMEFYERLRKKVPEEVLEMFDIPGMGPKSAFLFYKQAKVRGIEDLERAAKDGTLLKIKGIKEKTVNNILSGIEIFKKGKERMMLADALSVSGMIIERLKGLKQVRAISPAGSLRRMCRTVRDIDILVSSPEPEPVINAFTQIKRIKRVLAKGSTRASILLDDDTQADLRVVKPESFGAAMVYFTGSKDFNVRLRKIALKKQLKVNEYAVSSTKKGRPDYLAGKDEESVFKALSLSFIPPELREDRGEIELSSQNKLPKLVTFADIKGDLHTHSNFSDGVSPIEDMVKAALNKGYEYIAITDHSQGLKVAGGLDEKKLKLKREEIDRLAEKYKKIRIMFGTEVDIDSKGRLDYPDEILAGFDIVIAAIHLGFGQSRQEITRRLLGACESGKVHIIAHPHGKLHGVRPGYEFDPAEILKACRRTKTALEINSYPNRLDIDDLFVRKAVDEGVMICINTDSHDARHLDYMHLGLAMARKGWARASDCLNTRPYNKLCELLKK